MNKLTIIMPVYNVQNYIEACIDSLKNQTYSNFLCYIVDDGCLDDSITIASKLIENDARFILLHKENGGLSSARNYALPYVTSEYVTFIDSDDTIPYDYYEKMMQFVLKGCDLVVSDVLYCYEDASKNFLMKGLSSWGDKSRNHQGILSPMFAWNKIYKTAFFKDYSLKYPQGLWYEDIPVSTFIFAKAQNIGYCDTTAVNYRQREGSIMSVTQSKRVGEIFTILELVRNRFKEHGLYEIYQDELEYLHIEHLRLYGMFRFLRSENANHWVKLSDETLHTFYPKYKLNPYLKYLPVKYRLFIKHTHLLKGVIH